MAKSSKNLRKLNVQARSDKLARWQDIAEHMARGLDKHQAYQAVYVNAAESTRKVEVSRMVNDPDFQVILQQAYANMLVGTSGRLVGLTDKAVDTYQDIIEGKRAVRDKETGEIVRVDHKWEDRLVKSTADKILEYAEKYVGNAPKGKPAEEKLDLDDIIEKITERIDPAAAAKIIDVATVLEGDSEEQSGDAEAASGGHGSSGPEHDDALSALQETE